MHRFLIQHKLRSKINLRFDSQRNKILSNLQSNAAIFNCTWSWLTNIGLGWK
jgi:hypothetical protein